MITFHDFFRNFRIFLTQRYKSGADELHSAFFLRSGTLPFCRLHMPGCRRQKDRGTGFPVPGQSRGQKIPARPAEKMALQPENSVL